jgi:homoserine dehydrogenase
MTRTSLRVAVLGAGTVGSEVVRSLLERADRIAPADGCRLELRGVAVRDVEAAIARGIPERYVSDAPAHLVADDTTDVVVELIGGDEPARTLITAALSANKPVVTANKHVIAHHGPGLERAARESGAALRFEASVGGGIPILGPLASDLATNEIERVRGVVNGTTNYILTEMAAGRGMYEAVLRDAQQRGYAEADPSGDVEGRDAINKLVILARLAFGAWLDPGSIPDRPPSSSRTGAPGISGVTAAELEGAAALGLAVKLVALAEPASQGVAASVVPTAVPSHSELGATDGIKNRIEVRASPLGEVGFDGPGAGGRATSSAILGDLVSIARGRGSTWEGLPSAGTAPVVDPLATATRRWFFFVPGASRRAIPAGVAEESPETTSGVAVRTPWLTLDTLRSRLGGKDEFDRLPLYPIDD